MQPITPTENPAGKKQNRIRGLDTLRALAIVLVLCNHYAVVVTQEETFGLLTRWGWAGVDLFFVLSGYLIGSQIMAPLSHGRPFVFRTFMARRFLRTLPNYYVILVIYFLFPRELADKTTAASWQFLTFTQNFSFTHWGQTFSHSWSLCIEEQFYLILPLVTLIVTRLRWSLPLSWGLAIAGIVVGMAIRAWCWMHLDLAADGAAFYYSSLTRFDELLPGVLIAILQFFRPALFKKVIGHATLLIFGGLAFVMLALFWFGDGQIPDALPVAILGYPMLAAGFAMLVLSSLNPASRLNRIRLPGAAWLASWSYAVYLTHKPIFKLMLGPLHAAGISVGALPGIIIIMTAGIGGGWALFRLVETPFMRLRSHWFPTRSTDTHREVPAFSHT
ncbi:acyltransferase [Burkholderia stabilis]|uniref:Acyltransferase n=1 Tax=Burkholderia stabilis TaxID=95485 RepID=A0A4Q2A754_9BURK|nr:acyltransferase [Burkholderia stabilis]RXV65236.1 acyltransferase [Burkholderia stabilis]